MKAIPPQQTASPLFSRSARQHPCIPAGSDPPSSPITIGAERPYPPILAHVAHVSPFRVGLDALSLSVPPFRPDLPTAHFFSTLEPPRTCGAFRLKANFERRPTDRYFWTRRAEYVHDPAGHLLTLFSDRTRLSVPALFLKLRPAPGRLFSPREVVDLLAPVQAALRLPFLRLSRIELAADFAIGQESFERLGSYLWVPRIEGFHRVGTPRDLPTFYWGSRRSARQVKLYWKREADEGCARVEYTFRRRALRRMGITRTFDLLSLDWPRLAARHGRFVELDTGRTRRSAFVVMVLRDMLLHAGVSPVLRMKGPRYRRWIKGRLIPLPVQANLEAALAALPQSIHARQKGTRRA